MGGCSASCLADSARWAARVGCLAAAVCAGRIAAQPRAGVGADSLLALGHVAAAEAAYYAAVRANPRDPVARAQLGSFLAARGAPRVGAVLLEEARAFGGDSAHLARLLASVYARVADSAALTALAALEPSPLSADERRRAHWMAQHPPRVPLRDSVVRLRYRAGRGAGLGTVLLRVGRAEFAAAIDPATSGVVLPATIRGDVTVFGDSTSSVAAATVRISEQAFENVPVTLAPAGQAVRLGFDVLSPWSPTFDPQAGALTLHRPGRGWRPPAGTRVPALYDGSGLRLLFGGAWAPSSAPNAALLLGSRQWTWDARRGDVVLLTPSGAANPP